MLSLCTAASCQPAGSFKSHAPSQWCSCYLRAIQDMWVGGVIQNGGLKCHISSCLLWLSKKIFFLTANEHKITTNSKIFIPKSSYVWFTLYTWNSSFYSPIAFTFLPHSILIPLHYSPPQLFFSISVPLSLSFYKNMSSWGIRPANCLQMLWDRKRSDSVFKSADM